MEGLEKKKGHGKERKEKYGVKGKERSERFNLIL